MASPHDLSKKGQLGGHFSAGNTSVSIKGLVVATCRVPVDEETGRITTVGGMVVGVRGLASGQGDQDVQWFGFSQKTVKTEAERDANPLKLVQVDNIHFRIVKQTEEERALHLNGMSNQGLWPLLHVMPDRIAEKGNSYAGYLSAVSRLADAMMETLQDHNIVQVNDYQLLTLGHELRERGFKGPIVLFNHVPFVGIDPFVEGKISTVLHAQYDDIIKKCFGAYDRIGLQSRRDFDNLQSYIGSHEDPPHRFSSRPLSYDGKETEVGIYPISIDTKEIVSLTTPRPGDPDPSDRDDGIIRMIAAERLDYSKGLNEKMLGIERFLERHPEYIGRIQLLQITPLSRTDIEAYKETAVELKETIERVNARFTTPGGLPPILLTEGLPRDELLRKDREADICLLTPRIDGQNLVAKEFPLTQIGKKKPGRLVLSRYAGAAEEMGEAGTILVNPFLPNDIADKLWQAINMPEQECRALNQREVALLTRNDVHHWGKELLSGHMPAPSRSLHLVQQPPDSEPPAVPQAASDYRPR